MTQNSKLLLIVGPTASGKTEVAIELCQRLNGEIVSADSMQVYRGLDIGTAKPSQNEQKRARHHLIDLCEPDEEYSAARWALDAARAIAEIRSRAKQPIITGGTGFYLNALLHPQLLASAPPNPARRAELQKLADEQGNTALHALLQTLDAAAAERLHPNNLQRVIRAIEVAEYRKEKTAEISQQPKVLAPEWEYAAFGLEMPRELLYERINARADAMLKAGFREEVLRLISAGYKECAPLEGLGYKQMRACLENPEQCEEAIEEWRRETRRYAKRQITWFRHQLDVRWINALAKDGSRRPAPQIAQEIEEQFREGESKRSAEK